MKGITGLLLALAPCIIFSSCCARKAAARSQVNDTIAVKKYTEVIERVRDTIIYVTLPAESREVSVTADSSFLETSLASSTARITPDGTLLHALENKPVSEPVPVSVRERSTLVTEQSDRNSRTVTEIPVRMPLRAWERFLVCCGAFLCGLMLGKAALRCFRLFL